jgi:cell division protein FtsB
MAATRLQDDLLRQFREEKEMILSQIELLEPLAASIRKPMAQRLAGKGFILFMELLCWLLFLAMIASCFFLNKLFPFYLLFQLSKPLHVQDLGMHGVQMLQWSVYALILMIGLLFVFLARSLARVRQKNDVLNFAGSRIKTLVKQLHTRKASIDALEQKHFNEFPPEISRNVNEVPNLGYDPDEGILRKDA